MKNKMKKLNSKELSILKKYFTTLKFNNPFHLVYEKQVPNTGIVLLDGELDLLSKNKIQETLMPGFLLGVHELIHNEPAKFGCLIKKDSSVLLLEKSDILSALEDEDSEVNPILR